MLSLELAAAAAVRGGAGADARRDGRRRPHVDGSVGRACVARGALAGRAAAAARLGGRGGPEQGLALGLGAAGERDGAVGGGRACLAVGARGRRVLADARVGGGAGHGGRAGDGAGEGEEEEEEEEVLASARTLYAGEGDDTDRAHILGRRAQERVPPAIVACAELRVGRPHCRRAAAPGDYQWLCHPGTGAVSAAAAWTLFRSSVHETAHFTGLEGVHTHAFGRRPRNVLPLTNSTAAFLPHAARHAVATWSGVVSRGLTSPFH